MDFKVVEKFISINGEGNFAGHLSAFIRFAGCNLNCSYCDTMWANKADAEYCLMSEIEIFDYIKSTGITHVTLTGGEPLIQEGIYKLLRLLALDTSLIVEIETNGSIDITPFLHLQPNPPVFIMDYKLETSNMEDKMIIKNLNYLKKTDTVKFVVGNNNDLEKFKFIIKEYKLREKCNVHLSPIYGSIDMVSIVDFIKEHTLNGVKIQPQLHKIIWHPSTRGV
ncbi:MAG: putative 7-carboxy-7-deazaguanine synthase QueE [Eubacteriales bacterium]